MTTGERIKKIRKQKGMTQKELSDKLGITNNSLSRYEIGERQPSVDMLEKIANALGVQTWQLLYDGNSEITDISKRIQILRAEREMTQQELADIIGVETTEICGYENGTRKPTIEILNKIAVALDMPIEELLRNVDALSYNSQLSNSFERAMKGLAKQIRQSDKLLENYNKLNSVGKKEAVKRVEELTEIEKYTKPDNGENNE